MKTKPLPIENWIVRRIQYFAKKDVEDIRLRNIRFLVPKIERWGM